MVVVLLCYTSDACTMHDLFTHYYPKRTILHIFTRFFYRPTDNRYGHRENFMLPYLTNITLTLDKPNTISGKTKGELIECVRSFATWPALKDTVLEIRSPADIDPIMLQTCDYLGLKDFLLGKHKTQTCSKKENLNIGAAPRWA